MCVAASGPLCGAGEAGCSVAGRSAAVAQGEAAAGRSHVERRPGASCVAASGPAQKIGECDSARQEGGGGSARGADWEVRRCAPPQLRRRRAGNERSAEPQTAECCRRQSLRLGIEWMALGLELELRRSPAGWTGFWAGPISKPTKILSGRKNNRAPPKNVIFGFIGILSPRKKTLAVTEPPN